MTDPNSPSDATFTRRFWGDIMLEGLLMFVTLYIGWLIWLFFTAKTAQTPAKRLLNLYIVDVDTIQPVSAGQVWTREVLVKILFFQLVLGFLLLGFANLVNIGWALFDQRKQALHDKIVNTGVVYSPTKLLYSEGGGPDAGPVDPQPLQDAQETPHDRRSTW